MAADPRKRQKKLQRRTAKRQEKKHQLIRHQSEGMAGRLTAAAKSPVLHSWIMEDLFTGKGMGQVLISRALPNGHVAVAVFLVDRLCLGVKNALVDILPRSKYEDKFIVQTRSQYDVRSVPPALARKLVQDAVAYASDLGFSPHPDYHKAKLIFGDIDANTCTETFEFGRDGKPLFIAGPFDTPQRCRFIINVLTKSRGPGGFHFIQPMRSGDMQMLVPAPRQHGPDIDADEYGDQDVLEDMDEETHQA